MIKVICLTNLDLVIAERWPEKLPEIPRVGDFIESQQKWRNGFCLRLEVVSVTWRYRNGEYYPEIELHDIHSRSIKDFYEWYAPLIGKSVSYFI